jgi:hypothetical protein
MYYWKVLLDDGNIISIRAAEFELDGSRLFMQFYNDDNNTVASVKCNSIISITRDGKVSKS